jgi:erythritol transport system ATP-binding protein
MADAASAKMTMTAAHAAPDNGDIILRAEQVTKVFPGTMALDHVDFNIYRGAVNALIGENGAGKSTLMKIVAGVERPTSGRLLLDGKPIQLRSPLHAEQFGIGIIYQEMNLCPNLSVAENIFLGREVAPTGLVVDQKTQRARTRVLMQRLEHDIDPDALVSELRIGQQQIVEIAKALAQEVRILIMDEPTSALSAAEVEVLFKVIADLKAHGVSIIYISHKLEEITRISDYVTVLRDGKLVAEARTAAIDVPWIIEKMVGKNPANLFHKGRTEVGDEILRVEEMTLPRVGGGFMVDHVSLTLRKGEVVGLYGLMGAGRSELFECLAGVRPEARGRVYLEGTLLPASSVADRISGGIVLVPEDRQREGLVQSISVAHNMLLASLRNYFNGLFLTQRKERAAVTEMIKGLSIKVADPGQIITSLSGGNQQKVVVAKGLLTAPKILLLDEPSRGIDVAAKSEIFAIMERLAEQGFGVLFISSELKEVMAMSDRILVMSKGKITGEFLREAATEAALVAASAIGHGVSGKNEQRTGSERREASPAQAGRA